MNVFTCWSTNIWSKKENDLSNFLFTWCNMNRPNLFIDICLKKHNLIWIFVIWYFILDNEIWEVKWEELRKNKFLFPLYCKLINTRYRLDNEQTYYQFWWNVLGPRNTIIQFEPLQIHLYKPKESKISVRAAHDGGCVCGRIMSGAKIGERPRMHQICILWISSSKSPFTTCVSSSMLRLWTYFLNGHRMD